MKSSLAGFFLICLIATFPYVASAAEFVEQPIFLSKSPVTVGQKVRVYSIISNDTGDAFSGMVDLSQDGVLLGTTTITLATGSTQTVSVSWTPATGGDHVIGAQLVSSDGTVVQSVSKTFTVLSPPAPVVPTPDPTATSANTNAGGIGEDGYQSSTPIVQTIANVTPALATTSKSIFGGIDTMRSDAVKALNSQITKSQAKVGQSASGNEIPATATGFLYYLWLCYLNLLLGLRFIFDRVYVFYAVTVVLVCYIIWKIYSRVSQHKSYDHY